MLNHQEIKINDRNIRNTMSVLDGIYGNVPNDIQGFVHQRFVNEGLSNESVGRALTREEMDLLRREINKIVQDFCISKNRFK